MSVANISWGAEERRRSRVVKPSLSDSNNKRIVQRGVVQENIRFRDKGTSVAVEKSSVKTIISVLSVNMRAALGLPIS